MIFLKILLWIWQLPQNLLGLIMLYLTRAERNTTLIKEQNGNQKKVKIWWGYFIDFSISLGDYIIVDIRSDIHSVAWHERGHQIQSLIFGPLYLIVIGIPSFVFNYLWDKNFHKDWTPLQRHTWYHNRYPEKWADKLGGVE